MIIIKYFWIVPLVVLFIIWTIRSFADLINCIQAFNIGYVFESLEENSQIYFICIIVIPTLASFIYCLLA